MDASLTANTAGTRVRLASRTTPPLSVVIPCLNEADGIAQTLDALTSMRGRGSEVVVVDGGSTDATLVRARNAADIVVSAPRGRASQMNAGAAQARGDVLLFLHADTRLPSDADLLVLEGMRKTGKMWGRFDVSIDGRHPLLPVVAAAMNLRSRWTSIATGDQAIFVKRTVFDHIGGFRPIALMEDIALTAALRKQGAPLCIPEKATTSGRRWERHGVLRTILLMWRLRLAYRLGADPNALASRYAAHK